jgi:hypothetical protein
MKSPKIAITSGKLVANVNTHAPVLIPRQVELIVENELIKTKGVVIIPVGPLLGEIETIANHTNVYTLVHLPRGGHSAHRLKEIS